MKWGVRDESFNRIIVIPRALIDPELAIYKAEMELKRKRVHASRREVPPSVDDTSSEVHLRNREVNKKYTLSYVA